MLDVYRHPTARFSLPLPPAWEQVDDAPGVALIAVAPEDGGRFRASVVVTIEALAAGMTLPDWAAVADELAGRVLHRYLRIDDEPVEVGGREARRVLAHHTTEGNQAVTMEQWMLVEGGRGYTLTASAETLDYDRMADLFTAIAEGFRPAPGSPA